MNSLSNTIAFILFRIFNTEVPIWKQKEDTHVFYNQNPWRYDRDCSHLLGIPKMNPFWWFISDNEPCPADFKAGFEPEWLRCVFWNIRNPLANFKAYVIGHADRKFIRVGMNPTSTWTSDESGTFNLCVNRAGIFLYPFLSWRLKPCEGTFGWAASGCFCISFRRFKATGHEAVSGKTWRWW